MASACSWPHCLPRPGTPLSLPHASCNRHNRPTDAVRPAFFAVTASHIQAVHSNRDCIECRFAKTTLANANSPHVRRKNGYLLTYQCYLYLRVRLSRTSIHSSAIEIAKMYRGRNLDLFSRPGKIALPFACFFLQIRLSSSPTRFQKAQFVCASSSQLR